MAADQNPEGDVRDRVTEALLSSLGQAYDCTRVWEAWSYKTMTENDFSMISENHDRVDEIVDAILSVGPFPEPVVAQEASDPDPLPEVEQLRKDLAAAQADAIKFYLRCDRAAHAFQRGDSAEAERQIMGDPGESDLVKRIEAAMKSLPE